MSPASSGRIVMSRSGDVVLTKTWDERGQTGETMTLGAMDPVVQAWEHDEAGRVTLNETPWGSQAYAYDAEGRLSEVEDDEVGVFTFGWNADDQQTSLTRPNGMVTTSTFDALHPPSDLQLRRRGLGEHGGAALQLTNRRTHRPRYRFISAGQSGRAVTRYHPSSSAQYSPWNGHTRLPLRVCSLRSLPRSSSSGSPPSTAACSYSRAS